MKRFSTVFVLLLLCSLAYGQGARLNLYGSYVFDDYFNAYGDTYDYYEGTIEGGFQGGVGLEFKLRPEYGIELLYQRQATEAPTVWQSGVGSGIQSEDLQLQMNYVMLAGNRHIIKRDGQIETYAGLMIGALFANVENESTSRSESFTKFAWGMRVGVNIWGKGRLGFKAQAMLLSAVQAAGGGAYFGTGGSGVGVSSYSTIYQFSLGGGLAYKLSSRSVAPDYE